MTILLIIILLIVIAKLVWLSLGAMHEYYQAGDFWIVAIHFCLIMFYMIFTPTVVVMLWTNYV